MHSCCCHHSWRPLGLLCRSGVGLEGDEAEVDKRWLQLLVRCICILVDPESVLLH